MQPTECVPAFLIPIQMHMHMHVLVDLCYKGSRHVCLYTHRETETETDGNDTTPIVLTHSHPSSALHSNETMLLYLWTLYMGYNRVV